MGRSAVRTPGLVSLPDAFGPGPMIRRLALAVLLAASATGPAAQADDPAERRPRVGLALSGGAARGLAHIGVLKVLEEEGLPIDVVSGTSMGALVGGLYAMGYRADQIEGLVREIDMGAVFTGRGDRGALRLEQRRLPSETVVSLPVEGSRVRLPSGLRTGQPAVVALSRLTWPAHTVTDLTALPRPFAAVAVDLRAGEAEALTRGDLADAMFASMALPSALVPVRRGGRLFVDGGLVRNLPAEDALALGADVVVGVDVTGLVVDGELAPVGAEGGASVLDVLIQATTLGNRAGIRAQRGRVAVLIEPDLDGLGRLDFDRSADYVARGEAAARARLPAIRALVARVGGPAPPRPGVAAPAPVLVGRVRVVGVPAGGAAAALVRRRLALDLPRPLLPDDAEEAVARVYGTGLFDRVGYRVRPGPDGGAGEVEVRVVPQAVPDRLGVGARYDEAYGAGLLVSLALKNRLRFGDTAAITARLGSQFEVRGSYFSRLSAGSPLTVGAEAGLASAPYDAFDTRRPDGDTDPTRYRQRVASASAFAGLALGEAVLVGLRARAERQSTVTVAVPSEEEELFRVESPYGSRVEAVTGEPLDGDAVPFILGLDGAAFGSDVLSAGLFVEVDTRDRLAFARRGVRARAEAAVGQATLDLRDYREAYHDAFAEAYGRFDVPDVLLRDAPDPAAARERIAAEVQAEQAAAVAARAEASFPDQPFLPFGRFLVDVEAAVPAGPVSVFGRAAYAHGVGDGLPASAYTSVGGAHASAVYAEGFFPLIGLRPQQLVGTRGYLGVLGAQAEARSLVVRGFANVGDAYGEEDRFADDDDADDDGDDDDGDDDEDAGFDLERAVFGVGVEVGARTEFGPVSVVVGVVAGEWAPRVGVNVGFAF